MVPTDLHSCKLIQGQIYNPANLCLYFCQDTYARIVGEKIRCFTDTVFAWMNMGDHPSIPEPPNLCLPTDPFSHNCSKQNQTSVSELTQIVPFARRPKPEAKMQTLNFQHFLAFFPNFKPTSSPSPKHATFEKWFISVPTKKHPYKNPNEIWIPPLGLGFPNGFFLEAPLIFRSPTTCFVPFVAHQGMDKRLLSTCIEKGAKAYVSKPLRVGDPRWTRRGKGWEVSLTGWPDDRKKRWKMWVLLGSGPNVMTKF